MKYVPELSKEDISYAKQVCEALRQNDVVLDITAHVSLTANLAYTSELVKIAYDAGVKFVVGTDYTGCAVPDEIRHLKNCGISNLDILRAATVTGAEIIGMEGKLGVIAEGAEADIIVLNENPLEEISTLDKVKTTVLNGKIVYCIR